MPSSSSSSPPSRATGGLFDDEETNPEQDTGSTGFPGFSAVSPASMPSPPPITTAAAAAAVAAAVTSTSPSRGSVSVSPRTKGLFDEEEEEQGGAFAAAAAAAPVAVGGVRALGGQLNLTAAMLRNEVRTQTHSTQSHWRNE